jgi:hypothetical protein
MSLSLSGSGVVTGLTSLNTDVSDTELGYLDGVTSAIQTQFAGKADTTGNGAWTSYTPVLTAITTNPTMGTGETRNGGYVQIGKLVIYRFAIFFGTSGVNAGSGGYRISLPVNGKGTGGPGANSSGSLFLYDSSAGTMFAGSIIEIGASSTAGPCYYAQNASLTELGATAPWTWAANDQIRGTIIYEAA